MQATTEWLIKLLAKARLREKYDPANLEPESFISAIFHFYCLDFSKLHCRKPAA